MTTTRMPATRTGDGLNETAGPVPASTPEMTSSTKYEQNCATCATPTLAPAIVGDRPEVWR